MSITHALMDISYTYCRNIARDRAKNFYYAFSLLPEEKREALYAVYAFMHYCEDIADTTDANIDKGYLLAKWRKALTDALQGDYGDSLIMPAFCDSVKKFDIPTDYFYELIDGAMMDLATKKYDSFEDLYVYCYKVSSVIGLVSLSIFGYDDKKAQDYAKNCGIAFRLTDILRDVDEDSNVGRIYLPQEDLWAFSCDEENIAKKQVNSEFQKLMRFEVMRTRDFYKASLPLVDMVSPSSRAGLIGMIGIYAYILNKIEASGYNVFDGEIDLTSWERLLVAMKSAAHKKVDIESFI